MSIYEQVGQARLEKIMIAFYDRLFDDVMIGFLFQPFPKEHLIRQQINFTGRLLGASDLKYEGKGLREAHQKFSIRDGQFARRQKILRDVLLENEIPEEIVEAWLQKENSLRSVVMNINDKC